MQFPDDATLLARGKYSTLGKERRVQLERVQALCSLMITSTQGALRDCEIMPPVNTGALANLEACLMNLKASRESIVELSVAMLEIKPQAWPE